MEEQPDLRDFDSALFLLRMYLRFKSYLLPDDVIYCCRNHEEAYHFRNFSRDFATQQDESPIVVPLSSNFMDQNESGNEPRALKKRSKKARTERRSKSVEHRRKRQVSLHSSIPKSKDDLDFGTFTVIGRPPNPWFLENRLRRRERSLPDFKENLQQPRGFSLSSPHLPNFKDLDGESMLSQATKPIAASKDVSGISSNTSSQRNEVTINVNNVPRVNTTNAGSEKKLLHAQRKRQLSTLNMIELQRHFRECVITIKTSISEKTGEEQSELILKTLTSDLKEAEKLKKNFENLLEILGDVAEDCRITPYVRSVSPITDAITLQRQQRSHHQLVNLNKQITLKEPVSPARDSSSSSSFEDPFAVIEDFFQQIFHGAATDTRNNTTKKITTMLEFEGNSMSTPDSNSDDCSPNLTPRTSTSLPNESKTFTFYYTIDAEISRIEYLKLMNAIRILQQQKKQWNDKMEELHNNLKLIENEKTHLTNNNNILRESLEAANRAIKEINEKVHELKETLVPLRNENTSLREENEELKQHIEQANKENTLLSKDSEGLQKMKEIYEEKSKVKEKETEEFKNDMHEKFKKLEELYRNYQKDIEERNLKLIQEREELSKIHEAMKSEIDAVRRENSKFKKDNTKLSESNTNLEFELKQKKTENMKFLENAKGFENSQELENFYKREVEESNKTLAKMITEIENHKSEAWSFEQSNNNLKQDLKQLESHMRVLETKNEEIAAGKLIGEQQIEFLENEVELLRTENKHLESTKQEKSDLEITQNIYQNNMKELENKVRQLEAVKREHFSQNNENQRLKSEVDKVKIDLKNLESIKHQYATEKYKNEKLQTELKHLQDQLKLLEDQQKLTEGPYNAELKGELENIRAQMRELASLKQDKQLEMYTNELKGELASLKDQIRDLDVGRNKATNNLYLQSVHSNDALVKETHQASSTSVTRDYSGSRSSQENVSGQTEVLQQTASADKDPLANKNVVQSLQRRKSTGDINRIYVSKSTELSKKEKEDERLKQIEDRIRRKREKNTDWSLRTPSIEKLRRKSIEELTSMSLYDDDNASSYSYRRRERSPSIGKRSKSADPRGYDGVSRPFRERGRSPRRRDRSHQNQKQDDYQKDYNQPSDYHQYSVELTVDNRRPMYRPGSTHSLKNELEYRNKDFRDQQYVDIRPRPRSAERTGRGRVIQTQGFSNNYVDETSSDDYERQEQRKYKSLDYRLQRPVPVRSFESHNDNEMLTGAMKYRQNEAYTKLQHQQNTRQRAQMTPENRRRHKQPSTLQPYNGHQMQNWQPLATNALQRHSHDQYYHQNHYGNNNFYDHTDSAMNQRRNTLPLKDMTGIIEVGSQERKLKKENDHAQVHRSKTLDKDFRAKDRRLYEQNSQNLKKEEMIKTIKAEQALKLTLTPKQTDENLSKAPTKPPRSFNHNNNGRMLTQEELAEQEKMEKARQRMLRKMQYKNSQQTATKDDKRRPNDHVSITKSGIPVERSASSSGRTSTKHGSKFTPVEQTNDRLTDILDNEKNGSGVAHEPGSNGISKHSKTKSKRRENDDIFRDQDGEKFKHFEKKEKRETLKKHQRNHQTEKERIFRSHVKSNEDMSRESIKHGRPRSAPLQKRSTNLSSEYNNNHIETVPSQNRIEKYHCDICQKLNQNKRLGEPMRYCWERYYAVSSSTPETNEYTR